MSAEQDVKDIIAKTLNVGMEKIKLDEKLIDSLGVDSTEMVDLVVALEKKFGVKFEAKQVTKFSTPSQIIILVEGKKAAI
jgi:acyl carrier protein